jgi:hypothetical protein
LRQKAVARQRRNGYEKDEAKSISKFQVGQKNPPALALSLSESASISEGSKIRSSSVKHFAAPHTGGLDPAHWE